MALVENAARLNLDYLRLIPLGRSLFARAVGWRPTEVSPGIQRIRDRHPFYSALQIAIWRKQSSAVDARAAVEHLGVRAPVDP